MPDIHPTAIVDRSAEIAEDVSVGPYAIIEAETKIDQGTHIAAHAIIKKKARLGKNNKIFEHACIGGDPQDLSFKVDSSYIQVGENNTFREYATVHRSIYADSATIIGNNNYIMASAHVAHDCVLKDNIILANAGTLAGHVTVERGAFISGLSGVHQFCHVGAYVMIGGLTPVALDCLPFTTVVGNPGRTCGLNLVGLKRAGFTSDAIKSIKQAYKIFFRSEKKRDETLQLLEEIDSPEVKEMINLIRSSERGIAPARRK